MPSSRLLLVALALLGVLLALPSGSGETIIVDANGNGDHQEIADGLEAAEDGDIVRIWNGTYVEYNLTIEDQIIVRGNGTSTVINASWEAHGFIVRHDDVVISHLQVESSANGSVPDGPMFAGILIDVAEMTRLENLTLKENYVGLNVLNNQHYLHLLNSTITDSVSYGVRIQSSHYLRVDNSTIGNNGGVGLYCYYCHHAIFYYSVFEYNDDIGLRSQYAYNQTFYGTDFKNNGKSGLYLRGDGGGVLGTENLIQNAVFSGNLHGLLLSNYARNNTILNSWSFNNDNYGYFFYSHSTGNYLNNSYGYGNDFSLVFEDESHNNTINGGFYRGGEESILFSGDSSTGITLYETDFGESLSINSGSELLIKKNLRVKVTDNATGESWKIYDNQSDENREAYSGTHAMWLGNPDKNDGEYEDNWDFSFYTKDEISLGSSPELSIATWYETENLFDGGHVQISTDGGESWAVLTPAGGYPCSNVAALGDEGYCNLSNGWQIQNFSLSDYDNEDILLRFRFASDASEHNYEGWYIDDVGLEVDYFYDEGNWISNVIQTDSLGGGFGISRARLASAAC